MYIIASLGLGTSNDAPISASVSSRTNKTGAQKIDSIEPAGITPRKHRHISCPVEKVANNTQELKQAASAHSSGHGIALRFEVLYPIDLNSSRENTSKILRGSEGLALMVGASPTESACTTPDSPVKMPRQKKLKADNWFPQPADGKGYSPNEFVQVFNEFESLAGELHISGVASYLRRVKDETIAKGHVPVQITQLNQTTMPGQSSALMEE